MRPAAFFCAVVPPWLELPPEPDCSPPRLEAPGELAIFAARRFPGTRFAGKPRKAWPSRGGQPARSLDAGRLSSRPPTTQFMEGSGGIVASSASGPPWRPST
ncbi:MAG: hypothetical protein WD249_13735, partial [Gaiellaceae bacterium]